MHSEEKLNAVLAEYKAKEKQIETNAIIDALEKKLLKQTTNTCDYNAASPQLAISTITHLKKAFSRKIGEAIENEEDITLEYLNKLFNEVKQNIIQDLDNMNDMRKASIDIANLLEEPSLKKQYLMQKIDQKFPKISNEQKKQQIKRIKKTQLSLAEMVEIYILTLIKKGKINVKDLPGVPCQPIKIKNNLLDSINPTSITNNIKDAVMNVCNSKSYMDPNDLKSQRHYQPNSLNTLVKNVLYNISADNQRQNLELKLFRLTDPDEKNIIFTKQNLDKLQDRKESVYKICKEQNTQLRKTKKEAEEIVDVNKDQEDEVISVIKSHNVETDVLITDEQIKTLNEMRKIYNLPYKGRITKKNIRNNEYLQKKRNISPIKNVSDNNLNNKMRFKVIKK